MMTMMGAGVVSIHPSMNETSLRKLKMTEQQQTILSTWSQAPSSCRSLQRLHTESPMTTPSVVQVPQQYSADAVKTCNVLPRQADLQTKPETRHRMRSMNSQLSAEPVSKWRPGPVISTAADLCARAKLLIDCMHELQQRPRLL